MRIYDYQKQHIKGKLHAYERIELLLDKGSFHEIGSGIKNQEASFGLERNRLPYDGVITGYGYMEGKLVCIYSQDFTIMGGTLGKQHGMKIAAVIKMAIKNRCPLIGINDSGGARIQEGIHALAGYGEIFYYNTLASGYIPQITIIAGPCAGGAVYSPGITDFIFTIDEISNMFVTGPKVIKSVTNEIVTEQELGGSSAHSTKSGVAHFRYSSEKDCFKGVRRLLGLLPHNCDSADNSSVRYREKKQDLLNHILPEHKNKVYDMKHIIDCLLDKSSFMEVQSEFADNIIIGFGRLSGITVGIVASQPYHLAGVLDCDASDKAARLIRYCDCFDVPIITLTDVPGFLPGIDQEYKGIIRHGAKLLYAYSEATTTKINVIIRKAYGGAYIAMSSKHLRTDFVYAWPNAEIAVMGAEAAVELLHGKAARNLPPDERREFMMRKQEEYRTHYMNTEIGLNNGYIDEIIQPDKTRRRLFEDILSLRGKREYLKVNKKHGNMPL